MTYIMSDLHGEYDKYKKMLGEIKFSDEDTLYINGDICDRGKASAKIYLDVMARDNVLVIKGNHEAMAEEHLEYILKDCYESGTNILALFSERDLWWWFDNGGHMTLLSMWEEAMEERIRILDFIKSLPLYRTVDVNGKHYIMLHGGAGEYKEGMTPCDVCRIDALWSKPEFDGHYFGDENTRLIVGHTPTFLIRQAEGPAKIYRGKGNVIAVDCGAAYPERNGRLGCLCLDTGEEFYV